MKISLLVTYVSCSSEKQQKWRHQQAASAEAWRHRNERHQAWQQAKQSWRIWRNDSGVAWRARRKALWRARGAKTSAS